MNNPKALAGLSMHDLREHCKSRAASQHASKTVPSDITLKQWCVDLSASDVTIRGNAFRNIIAINSARQGIHGTTIEEEFANEIYEYSLLKLGVHTATGTIFTNHCSANELAFKQTNHYGGRTGGLFQHTAEIIFAKGCKSPTGFVKVSYKGASVVLCVVRPEFFIGSQNQDSAPIPDVMWGQMIKSCGSQASPAVQLSEHAQSLITRLKAEGLNDRMLQDISVAPVLAQDLTEEQKIQSQAISQLTASGMQATEWAAAHVAETSRKR